MSSSAHVVSVGEADFLEQVLAHSREQPVLVDFWAPWCGPCRALGPLLESLAEEGGGRFRLAKVDTDQNPGLAQRHQVRGIPAVKLFRDGQMVGEFVGALPRAEVVAFLDRYIPDAATAAAQRAATLIAEGDFAGADAALEAAPDSDRPAVLLARARVALLRGRAEQARALATEIPARADEHEQAQAVLTGADLAIEGSGKDEAALDGGPEGSYLRAGRRLAEGRLTDALDALLEVVRRDRRFRDDGARKCLVALFEVAGVRSELSDSYRRKLADVL